MEAVLPYCLPLPRCNPGSSTICHCAGQRNIYDFVQINRHGLRLLSDRTEIESLSQVCSIGGARCLRDDYEEPGRRKPSRTMFVDVRSECRALECGLMY